MTIKCTKCNLFYDDKSEKCPYCGTSNLVSIKQRTQETVSQEQKFCMNCGAKMEKDAAFCMSCGSRAGVVIPSEQYTRQQYKPVQRTNFVMNMLRGSGNPNGVVRVLCVISSLLFLITQFFGMKYMVSFSFMSDGYKGNVINFFWQVMSGSSLMRELIEEGGRKWVLLFWILLLVFAIGFLVLLILCIQALSLIIGDYHVESVVDAIKAVSVCAIVIFGITVLLGNILAGIIGATEYLDFKVDVLSYLALIWAVIMRIFSGMIIKSQLDDE